jgi:hypothetical protein
LAREWLVLLPPELNAGERSGLVCSFASELANKYRCAVDICVHEPRPGADSRNHHAHLLMTTREGGAQAKEYMAKYSADRVRNFSSVWLAGTMGCCECHDHKFDPIATREFYGMEAFFAHGFSL